MTEPWFDDMPRSLALLSLLAVFAWPAQRGRFKAVLMTIWIAALVGSALLLSAAGIAAIVEQPPHVIRGLAVTGLVFGFAFGVSFPALRRCYRDAELRKTIAADL